MSLIWLLVMVMGVMEYSSAQKSTLYKYCETKSITTLGFADIRSGMSMVDLSECEILQIEADAFHRNPGLTFIDLRNNYIRLMTGNVLANLTKLQYFSAENNLLVRVNPTLFRGLAEMVAVYLNDNYLQLDELPRLLENFDMDEVDVSNNNRRLYEPRGRAAATRFTLDHAFGLRDVVALDLSRNSLAEIAPDVFSRLRSLKRLDLSFNHLGALHPDHFAANARLDRLDLYHNRIDRLSADAFKNNARLSYLDLSFNRLKHIETNLFMNNRNLQKLFLSNNELATVAVSNFFFASNITNLRLNGNRLQRLPEEVFFNNHLLKTIDLRRNRLETLPVRLFSNNRLLTHVHLSKNNLTRVERGTFDRNDKIYILELAENRMTNVDGLRLPPGNRVRVLNLNGNEMTRLSLDAVLSCRELHFLWLDGNYLDELPARLLELGRLHELVASRNRITRLADEFFGAANAPQRLRLAVNPLKCACINRQLELLDERPLDEPRRRVDATFFSDGRMPYCVDAGPACDDRPIGDEAYAAWLEAAASLSDEEFKRAYDEYAVDEYAAYYFPANRTHPPLRIRASVYEISDTVRLG